MKCLQQATGPGACLQPCASLSTGRVSHCSCCWPSSWGSCIVLLLSSAVTLLPAKSFRMWISWSCNCLFGCSYSAASLKWRHGAWPEATAGTPGAPQGWSGLCQAVTKPVNISGSRFPCSKTGMLKPLCLARSKFLSLCSDHSTCKVPYRAQSAHQAAGPRGCPEPHSCKASLSVVALPTSWQCCAVGGEALKEWGEREGWSQEEKWRCGSELRVLAVSGLASPASKPYHCLLPSLHLPCWHFPLISCQHCLADLCSTSYPPSGLGGLLPHYGNRLVHQ